LIELRPAAEQLVEVIASRLAAQGGIAALIIDYGYTAPRAGDSLQALRRKRPAHPLAQPGEADLTAHVDFAALAKAARRAGAAVHGPVTQGAFLTALGIEARAARLAREATESERQAIAAALHRLIDPQSMGSLFKVMALTPARAAPPAGFEA
jgi:SAM-dependent MidA family methyltransferase